MAKLTLKKGCAIFNGKEQITNYDWEDGRLFENTILLYKMIKNKRAFGGFTYTITIIDRTNGTKLFEMNKIRGFRVYSTVILLSRYNCKMTDEILTSQCAAIDLNGNYIIPFGVYLAISNVKISNNEYFEVFSKKGKGICDKYGNEIINPRYDDVFFYNNRWGYFVNFKSSSDELKGIYFATSGKCTAAEFKSLYFYSEKQMIVGEKEDGTKILYSIEKGEEILGTNLQEYCKNIEKNYSEKY